MRAALVLLACAASLAACGKVGDLERPGPMFGRTAADGAPPPTDPSAPVTTVDPRDRSTDNAPARVAPDPAITPR